METKESEKKNPCPVCKSTTGFQYISQTTSTPHFTVKLDFGTVVAGVIVKYSRCLNCGLILQNPRMSDKEIEAFYTGGTYRSTMQNTPEELDKDEDLRAQTIASTLSKLNVNNIKRHLDIGASRGFLLDWVGAKVRVGVELNEEYHNDRNGNKYYKRLEEVAEKKFDLVSLVHVLEHVSHPMDVLLQATRKTQRGGHVYIEVPSDFSKGGWARLAHLFHFEPPTMRYMLNKAGLVIKAEYLSPHYHILTTKP